MVVSAESAVTLWIDATTEGKTVRVTQNVHHTLNNIHFICLRMEKEETEGARNDCDNCGVMRVRG